MESSKYKKMGLGVGIANVFGLVVVKGGPLTLAGKLVAFTVDAAISVGVQRLSARRAPDQKQGRSGNLRSSTMAHQVVLGEVRKGGLIAYVNGSGAANNNKYLYLAVVVAAHECQSLGGASANSLFVGGMETTIATSGLEAGNAVGRLHDYAHFVFHLGSGTQAADAALVAGNANWTTAHRFRGRAYISAVLRESPARYPAFIPALTIDIKGAKSIYDPRTNTTAWSANPALQAAWLLETYVKIPRARIDEDTVKAAANVCDEDVTIKDGTTVDRYESHGFFDLEGSPEDWLDPVVRAMAGAVVEHDGTYYIHAGKYTASVVTITDDHLVGDISLMTARSNLERPNTAKGIFVSPETYDAPAEYVPVTTSTFLSEDNNVETVMELDLEFVASHEQARRVASIYLNHERMDETVECVVNLLIGLDIKPWDTVTLDSKVLGVNATYRVVDHALITETEGPRAYVRLRLRRVAASLYAWDPSTQEKALTFGQTISPNEPVQSTPSVDVGNDDKPADGDGQVGSIHVSRHKGGPFRMWKKVERET